MPAVKCLPVEESTITRASPASLSSFTSAGSSRQNAGVIVFMASGRFMRRCATPSFSSSSKHSAIRSAPPSARHFDRLACRAPSAGSFPGSAPGVLAVAHDLVPFTITCSMPIASA